MANLNKGEKIKSIVLFLAIIVCQFFTYSLFDALGVQISENGITIVIHVFVMLLAAFCFRKGLLEDFKALKRDGFGLS